MEPVIRKPRRVETAEEHADRLVHEAKVKRHAAAADDEAVDRAIRRNIELHGA